MALGVPCRLGAGTGSRVHDIRLEGCNMAKDAFWFRHDANARRDSKIMGLRAKYGWAGYGLWWAIVEILRESPGYRMAIGRPWQCQALAMELGVETDYLSAFLKDCIEEFKDGESGLLQTDGEYIWSDSLCRRMGTWDERKRLLSEAGKRGADARWGDQDGKANGEGNGEAIATPMATPMAIREDKKREDQRRVDHKKEKDPVSNEPDAASRTPHGEIVSLYNTICTSLPSVKEITDSRRRTLKAHWRKHPSIERFRMLFEKAEASEFLSGRNGKWQGCDFDWLIEGITGSPK